MRHTLKEMKALYYSSGGLTNGFVTELIKYIGELRGSVEHTTNNIDALAKRCGFPASNDLTQMLDTVGNKVDRLTVERDRAIQQSQHNDEKWRDAYTSRDRKQASLNNCNKLIDLKDAKIEKLWEAIKKAEYCLGSKANQKHEPSQYARQVLLAILDAKGGD